MAIPPLKDEARKAADARRRSKTSGRESRRNFQPYLAFGEGPRDRHDGQHATGLLGINFVEFLRDVGRHFSVTGCFVLRQREATGSTRRAVAVLPRIQLHDPAGLMIFVELNKRYGHAPANGRLGSVGQHHKRPLDLGHRHWARRSFTPDLALLTTSSGTKDGHRPHGRARSGSMPEMMCPTTFLAVLVATREEADVGRFPEAYTTMPWTRNSPGWPRWAAREINEAKKCAGDRDHGRSLLWGGALADQSGRNGPPDL